MHEPDLYDPRQPHQLAVVGAMLCFVQPQDACGVNMWCQFLFFGLLVL